MESLGGLGGLGDDPVPAIAEPGDPPELILTKGPLMLTPDASMTTKPQNPKTPVFKFVGRDMSIFSKQY